MASKTVQLYQDDDKTIKEYPITLTKTVYDENENRLDTMIGDVDDLSGIGDGSISGAITSLNSSLENLDNRYVNIPKWSVEQINSTTLGNAIGRIEATTSQSIGLKNSTYIVQNLSWGTSDSFGTQMAYERAGAKEVYTRTCNNGTWSSWNRFANIDDMKTAFDTTNGIFGSNFSSTTSDLNTLPNGTYRFEATLTQSVYEPLHYPSAILGNTFRHILIISCGTVSGSNGYRQQFLLVNNNEIYHRTQSWDSWQSWQRLATSDIGNQYIVTKVDCPTSNNTKNVTVVSGRTFSKCSGCTLVANFIGKGDKFIKCSQMIRAEDFINGYKCGLGYIGGDSNNYGCEVAYVNDNTISIKTNANTGNSFQIEIFAIGIPF